MERRNYFRLSDLRPGMRVLFAPEWMGGGVSHNLRMNRWFGQIVTVQHVCRDKFFTIEEDVGELPHQYGGGWYWPPEIIQEIICEKEEEFEAESDDAFLNLLNVR